MIVASPANPVTVEEALQYEIEGLEAAIEKCQANIKIFEDAIQNERHTVDRYREMITIIKVHGKNKT